MSECELSHGNCQRELTCFDKCLKTLEYLLFETVKNFKLDWFFMKVYLKIFKFYLSYF